ncbi:MAG TPA: ribonuclease H-like domain-containing protein [Bacillota bacterium]
MASSSPLVFDIETVGLGWEALAPDVQDYLLERARNDEERAAVPQRLALHPGTGRVVAIGLWRPEEDRGGVLVADDAAGGREGDAGVRRDGDGAGRRDGDAASGRNGDGAGRAEHADAGVRTDHGDASADGGDPTAPGWVPFEDGALIYRGPETRILEEFWRYVEEGAGTLITFNGRGFDGPFLMLRSAILGIAPSRNLVPYRYSLKDHCDLAEVLTFYGVRKRDSLHFWCRQFGIPSPKDSMDGSGVEQAFRQGRLDDIARYCLQDVRATAELYRRLQPLIALLERS